MAHRLISATYQLYIEENGQEVLKEQITEERPLSVYTGLGMLLPTFEERLADFEAGSDYDFVLSKLDAYGEYDPKGRATLSKEMFSPNGVFDEKNVYEGAIIPLEDEKGQRYYGSVVAVGDASEKTFTSRDASLKTARLRTRKSTTLWRRANNTIAAAIVETAVVVAEAKTVVIAAMKRAKKVMEAVIVERTAAVVAINQSVD